MTATSQPSYQTSLQFQHREGKRAKIEQFFLARIGERISSAWLHGEFGSSFRSRVSEINADATAEIVIKNEFVFDEQEGAEISFYWAELRARHLDLG